MTTRTPRLIKSSVIGTVLAVLAVATSCGDDGDGNLFVEWSGESGRPDDAPEETQPEIPDSLDAVADGAIEDVEAFWEEAYPSIYGGPLRPLEGGWHAYNSTVPPPPCGPDVMTYQEAQLNAFYCNLDDLIAYDDEQLFPWLDETFGGFTIAIVLAHEFGHAVQERQNELGTFDSSVRIEMQADCFAGAWVGWIDDGNSDNFAIDVTQLDSAVMGMIAIRDEPGADPDSPWAHGSGFDRVASFQDGFENGPERCAEYTALHRGGELAVTQIVFDSHDEMAGDVPLEDGPDSVGLYTLAEEYLEIFYERLFEEQLGTTWRPVDGLVVFDPESDEVTCGGETLSGPDQLDWFSAYCADENVVVIDGRKLAPDLLREIGDFAVAAEIARLWAFAAQEQVGIEERNKDTSLQADCLSGYWAGALFPDETDATALGEHPDQQRFPDLYPRLSAGDLDEAIIAMIAFSGSRREDAGTVFERAAAMRGGVLDGIAGREGISGCSEFHPFE